MKAVILLIGLACLQLALSAPENLPACKEDDCFCVERPTINQISEESGRQDFLNRQINFDKNEFDAECNKIDVEQRKRYGELIETTTCDSVKIFLKKQILLWEFFCSCDEEFRKGISRGFKDFIGSEI